MEYGLIGARLGHSFSPEIHKKIADYRYELCELTPEGVEKLMRERSFRAINVTIPYKETVIPMLDEISTEARRIGAVNTVVNRGGRLYGYNTDYSGAAALVRRVGMPVKGKRCSSSARAERQKRFTPLRRIWEPVRSSPFRARRERDA